MVNELKGKEGEVALCLSMALGVYSNLGPDSGYPD
jgi:hypothetical protein